jgi:hypothetical protein
MEDSPFAYGKLAVRMAFTDRDSDRERLSANISNRVNTILISPRRWGKSSLVKRVGVEMMEADSIYRFCHIDLFAVRSEQDFFRMYTETVLRSMGGKWDELLSDLKEVAQRLVPFISVSFSPDNEFKMGLDVQATGDFPEEILALPEKLAAKRGLRPVICLDEFQNISAFTDALPFQRLLRSVWQQHTLTTYCLYGSKRHMMTEMFSKRSRPFYRFGEFHFLKKISEADWIPFIMERFASTGRSASAASAQRIARRMECHPYYVQQYCHHIWTMVSPNGTVDEETESHALEHMINSNLILYQREMEGLSAQQIGLLLAVAAGEGRMTSAAVIRKYGLGSSAYVVRTMRRMEDLELIDSMEGRPEFVDPVFRMWFVEVFGQSVR